MGISDTMKTSEIRIAELTAKKTEADKESEQAYTDYDTGYHEASNKIREYYSSNNNRTAQENLIKELENKRDIEIAEAKRSNKSEAEINAIRNKYNIQIGNIRFQITESYDKQTAAAKTAMTDAITQRGVLKGTWFAKVWNFLNINSSLGDEQAFLGKLKQQQIVESAIAESKGFDYLG